MAVLSRLLMALIVVLIGAGFAQTVWAQDGDTGGGMMPEVHTNLYATLEFVNFKHMDSYFDARNIELLVNGRMGPRLSGLAEIEFERSKAVGEDQGAIEVEQGWIQYEVNSLINLRTGIILVPFGRYNLTHFDPFQDLTGRPLMAIVVAPTTWAEAGAGFVGSFFPTENSVIDYQVFVVNGLTDAITDVEGLHEARGLFGEDNNNNKGIAGRVALSVGRHELGASIYHGSYDGSGDQITGYDADGMLAFGPLEIVAEWAKFVIENGLNSDGFAVPTSLEGAYVQANYHFWFDFLNQTFLGSQFEDPTFTLVVTV